MVGAISGSAPYYSYLDQLTGAAKTPAATTTTPAADPVDGDSSDAVTGSTANNVTLSSDVLALLQGDTSTSGAGLISQLLQGSTSTTSGSGLISQLLNVTGGSVATKTSNPVDKLLSVSMQAMMYKGAYQGAVQKSLAAAHKTDYIQKLLA